MRTTAARPADTRAFSDLVQELSARCQVSKEAARIHLNTLGLARSSSEPMSALNNRPQGGSIE